MKPALLLFVLSMSVVAAMDPAGCRAASASEQKLAAPLMLQNGYVRAVFDRSDGALTGLYADHDGKGAYGANLLAHPGLRFSLPEPSRRPAMRLQPMKKDRHGAGLRVTWPAVCGSVPSVRFTLGNSDRSLYVVASLPEGTTTDLALRQWFALGQFDGGVFQSVAGTGKQFRPGSRLLRMYTIDRSNGSVALVPDDPDSVAGQTTLVSTGDPHSVALHLEAASAASRNGKADRGASVPSVTQKGECGPVRRVAFHLFANDRPFPAFAVPAFASSADGGLDSEAYSSAIYATAAGVLGSYEEPGAAYPTLATPKRAYGDSFNFFDPDAWPIVATLSYSGDPLLQSEARKVLERSEAGMLSDGQLPHHFEGGKPVYLSIARSKQTGPNLFWVLAALEYASATGDEAWLHAHYQSLRKATEWILSRFDPTASLLDVEGPLFIDVFRRSGYTLDTNAMSLHMLDVMAEAADAEQDSASGLRYREFESKLREGLKRQLWDGHDHFLTERHRDGTTRDFVDADGNFAALAFGALSDPADVAALVSRLDANPRLHPGSLGTWVSERRYDKSECYGENDGDSDVTMGRIWWLEELARVRLRDHATFDATLNRLRKDVLENVWLHERYDAAGKPAHNPYYHEYPEMLSMVLREFRYGVRLSPSTVRIAPFGVSRYELHLGPLEVRYSPEAVFVMVPGNGERTFIVEGLAPSSTYKTADGRVLRTGADGALTYTAHAGAPVSFTLEGRVR